MRIEVFVPRLSESLLWMSISIFRQLSAMILLTMLALPVLAAARFENPLENSGSQDEISGVNAIVQDRHGFIWIAGENGLGRFDGQTVQLYQAREDSSSLPSSFVWDLVVDHDNVLWAATTNGLSRYESSTETFHLFTGVGKSQLPSDIVSTIKVDAANNIYAGTFNGLYRIDAARRGVEVFFPDPPIERASSAERLRDMTITPDGKVWIATLGMGVVIFDPATATFEYLVHRPGDANSLPSNNVKAIEIDSAGNVWIGTYGAGISIYNPRDGSFHNLGYGNDAPTSLRSGVIWELFRDSEGTMWVTLDQGGLAKFDSATGTFEHFLHDPYAPDSVASNQLRAIFEDARRDLWIGAFPSGVSLYNRSKQVFRTFYARSGDPRGLSHSAVTSLFEDSTGTVWVGTEGGLNALDVAQGTFKQFRADPQDPHALLADPVLSIEEDSWGNLWVGTWAGGLHRFNRDTGQFTRYLPEPGGINSKFIWDIVEDNEKNLWVATEDGGLNRYQRESDSFVSYRNNPRDENSLSGDYVWTLLPARDGHLWVGMFAALNRLAPDQTQFYRFPIGAKDGKSISSKNIRSLYEDSRGLIWIGSLDRGVSIFDPVSETFRYLDVQQGLPSAAVASVLEDDRGNMWLATANGLARVEYPTLNVTVYRKEHGLAGNNYNRDASLKDRQGNLYFGSTEGLTVFHPDNLVREAERFPVQITGFRILNKDVEIGQDSPLTTSIVEATEIRLASSDIMFSVDFAALNYRNRTANRYAYKLEGFDRDWIAINNQATATYTNIDPGRYTLRIKAASGNGEWNERVPALNIIIEPPLWRTWWAYLGYLTLVLAALYFRREHRQLRQRAETYRTQSLTDPLTRVYNREGIAQASQQIFMNSETRKETAVMLLDIDHFKRVNDRRGHDTGDLILTGVASLVLHNVRHGDYVGRWGGEEFVLICSNVTPGSAQVIAEKIRCAVANHLFETAGTPVSITISIGMAVTQPHEAFEAVLKRADIALYQAKAQGRNCVCLADVEAIDS